VTHLLDTNVVSEWAKPHPEPGVVSWPGEVDEESVYLSVVSFAELRRGVELLPDGRRRDRLAAWIEDDLGARSYGRVLRVDRQVADAWGDVQDFACLDLPLHNPWGR
jgi:predicted nucleic acid-binding protein